MLSTGIRTPVGIKVTGDSLGTIEEIGTKVEQVLRKVPGDAQRIRRADGPGVLPRLRVGPEGPGPLRAQRTGGPGGAPERRGGRERDHHHRGARPVPVNVRYSATSGRHEALGRVLSRWRRGGADPPLPARDHPDRHGAEHDPDEDGLLTGYIYVDISGRDPAGYIEEARKVLKAGVPIPHRLRLAWSGQFEAMERVRERLWVVVPVTLLLIFLLLMMNTRSLTKTLIVVLAVPSRPWGPSGSSGCWATI